MTRSIQVLTLALALGLLAGYVAYSQRQAATPVPVNDAGKTNPTAFQVSPGSKAIAPAIAHRPAAPSVEARPGIRFFPATSPSNTNPLPPSPTAPPALPANPAPWKTSGSNGLAITPVSKGFMYSTKSAPVFVPAPAKTLKGPRGPVVTNPPAQQARP